MKRIGIRVLYMVLVLALIFAINVGGSIFALDMINRAGGKISKSYLPIEQNIAEVQKSNERCQKFINIIVISESAELQKNLTDAINGEWLLQKNELTV